MADCSRSATQSRAAAALLLGSAYRSSLRQCHNVLARCCATSSRCKQPSDCVSKVSVHAAHRNLLIELLPSRVLRLMPEGQALDVEVRSLIRACICSLQDSNIQTLETRGIPNKKNKPQYPASACHVIIAVSNAERKAVLRLPETGLSFSKACSASAYCCLCR